MKLDLEKTADDRRSSFCTSVTCQDLGLYAFQGKVAEKRKNSDNDGEEEEEEDDDNDNKEVARGVRRER